MDRTSLNQSIRNALINIRDGYYLELRARPLTEQYAELYQEFKRERKGYSDDDDILRELSELMQDTSKDEEYINIIIDSVKSMNENLITEHFVMEVKNLFEKIFETGKFAEIGSVFIEYDYYYHYNSCAECYGKQPYPIVLTPRYISSEYNYNDRVFFIEKAINFKPAWPDCKELDSSGLLNLNMEKLFQLHSRVLLHEAFTKLDKDGFFKKIQMDHIVVYINEHDCEVNTLFIM